MAVRRIRVSVMGGFLLLLVSLDHRFGAPLRVHELRRDRSRSLRSTRRAPRSARSPFCVHVVAIAAGARAQTARDFTG